MIKNHDMYHFTLTLKYAKLIYLQFLTELECVF